MTAVTKKGGKKNRKLGRDEKKCQLYQSRHTREKNKIKRILKSSGVIAANAYAEKHDLVTYAKKLIIISD